MTARDARARLLVSCACGFRWFSRDTVALERAIQVHLSTCEAGVTSIREVEALGPDPARHCRMDEPPQIPPASRADRDGQCSWNCRGSYSWHCHCPCMGERHGENHLWDPDERAKSLDALYGGIERAKPRGDWKGRKST